MIYTYDEAFKASFEYFGDDALAADVFVNKYALRDVDGNLVEKTPVDMHHRLAKEFARIEQKYANPMSEDEIFELLSSWKVVPQGSPMAAIGDEHRLQSLSNCFVVDLHDSYGGILKTDQELVQIMKRRGGVGIDLSALRPRGTKTKNAARTTDGIKVFMERFSNTTREVAQGGRRGALMQLISCHALEVDTFIDAKRDKTKITGANVSVKYTDEFMNALENNEEYEQRFPVDKDVEQVISRKVKASEVWNKTVSAAHACAEPGVMFWDTIIKNSPADCYSNDGFKTIASNPCSELPLCAYDACRLVVVNLSKFIKNKFTPEATFDYDDLKCVTIKTQRLLDDLVDLEIEAIDKIIEKVKSDPEPDDVKKIELDLWNTIKSKTSRGRRTGLGITALGDAIAYMGMKYDSDESIEFVKTVQRTIAISAYTSSTIMASERGSFSVYDANKEINHPFLERLFSDDDNLKNLHSLHGRRNIAILTISPAGSVSVLTQTTSGCEPVVFLVSKRRRKVPRDAEKIDFIDKSGDCWQEYEVVHKGVKDWMSITGSADIKQSPYFGATCEEIDWKKSIELQANLQLYIDHAVSKTLNLHRDTPVEVVDQILRTAWKMGLKGITVYRDGCRDGVIVNADKKKEEKLTGRPKELECEIHRANVKGEAYTVLVGFLDGKPYEIFAGLSECVAMPKKVKKATLIRNGKNSDGVTTYNLRIPIGNDDNILFKDIVNMFNNPLHGVLTRLLSLSLRKGVDVYEIVEQIKKDKNSDMTSFASVLARVLKQYIPNGKDAGTCENCGGKLVYVDGCVHCEGCLSSKCS